MYCSKCGCKNEDNAMFCKNCGSPLNKINIEKNSAHEKVNTSKSNKNIILISITAIISIVILGTSLYFYFLKQNNNEKQHENKTNQTSSNEMNDTLSKAVDAVINKDFRKLYDQLYIDESISYPKEEFVEEWNDYVNNGEMEEDISNGLKKAKDKEPDKHLIKSNVIKINVADFQEENIKENSKPVKVPINIKLFNAITIKDEIEMVKVKGEWKITLDSIYKLIENQEKIFS